MSIISYEAPTESQRRSPIRLRAAIDSLLEWPIKELHVEGLDHLKELPADTPAIVVASHQTGLDMPIAIKALGNHLDMAVTDQSTHREAKKEISGWMGQKLAGEENFIPISYEWDGDKKVPSMFKPSDTQLVIQAMAKGKDVLIAAYNPVESEKNGHSEPPQPGYSAAYLSLLTGQPILPIAIKVGKARSFGRADAEAIIGAPLLLPEVPEMARMQEMFDRRQRGEKLERDDIIELSDLVKLLRERGKVIFDTVRHLEEQSIEVASSTLHPLLAKQAFSAENLNRQLRTDSLTGYARRR